MASGEEIQRRVNVIVNLIAKEGAGIRRNQIHEWVRHNEKKLRWNVCLRTIDNYISRARSEMAKIATAEKEVLIGLNTMRFERLLKKAEDEEDLRLARLLVNDVNRTLGVSEYHKNKKPEKTKVQEMDWSALDMSELKGLKKMLQKISPPDNEQEQKDIT